MDTATLGWAVLLGEVLIVGAFVAVVVKMRSQTKEGYIDFAGKVYAIEPMAARYPAKEELKDSSAATTLELEQLRKKNAQLEDAVSGKTQEASRAGARYAELEVALKKKNEQIQILEKQHKEDAAEIDNLKTKIERAQKEFLQQKDAAATRTSELESLQEQTKKFQTALSAKEEQLRNAFSESATLKENLKTKDERVATLEKESQEMSARLKELGAALETAEKEEERLKGIIEERKVVLPEVVAQKSEGVRTEEERLSEEERLRAIQQIKKKKIGEVLLEYNFISKDILEKALEYQAKFGGNLTQYLLANGFIDEARLAQCLCTQFGIPYLPLTAYRISPEIIQLIPAEIAGKFLLVPVDKIGKFLTLVMADPLDVTAIKEVEGITGCTVRPFVGIISEVIEALKAYYNVSVRERGPLSEAPFFVETDAYEGIDRRQWPRFDTEIEVYLPIEGEYKKAKTKNVSRGGILMEADRPLPVGSLLCLQINLPKEFSLLPCMALVQVIRVDTSENNTFDIGLKTLRISEEELYSVIEYASTHQKK